MKNKKGFTLVEIISVIVILGLLIIVSVPIIGNVSTNIKKKTLNTKIDNIEKAAVLYAQEHREYFTSDTSVETCLNNYCPKTDLNVPIDDCYCYNSELTVAELLDEGKIKEDIIIEGNKKITNPLDETKYINDCKIQLYMKYGKIYAVYLESNTVTDTDTMCWYE